MSGKTSMPPVRLGRIGNDVVLEMLMLFSREFPTYSPIEVSRVNQEFGLWQIVTEDSEGNRAKFKWDQKTKHFYRPGS